MHTIDVWAPVEIVAGMPTVCLPGLQAFVGMARNRSRQQPESGRHPAAMKGYVALRGKSKAREA